MPDEGVRRNTYLRRDMSNGVTAEDVVWETLTDERYGLDGSSYEDPDGNETTMTILEHLTIRNHKTGETERVLTVQTEHELNEWTGERYTRKHKIVVTVTEV
jgi:hypothetical protein